MGSRCQTHTKKPHPKTVKEWRPISLLNVDYKILTTIIANRLKPILQQYISQEQQCGVPNRQIYNNHLNIKSAIEFSNDISQPLVIIQIDFNNAFDTISQNFILDIAKQIRIPSSLVNWFKVILTNVTSQILVNRIKTNQIFFKRGIRQGCPLNMLLFILGTEPLTQKINKNSSIKGLSNSWKNSSQNLPIR